jgi:phosphate transport system permease protein
MKSWPKIVTSGIAVIPVAILLFIVGSLVSESLFAINGLGIGHLFSKEFSGVYSSGMFMFGMLPAIWGTILVVAVALVIAFPSSLALAILSSECPIPAVGRWLRTLLGMLAGIPPVIYALMEVVFFTLFIRPKFTGFGLVPEMLPHQRLPIDGSTLLAGILLALLIIPFMAPLMDDAMRNVPGTMREASTGVGASRWYTLRRIVIPWAIPGILSALAIGTLKAMGDVVIVGWITGWESKLPQPLFDIISKTAPLTSTGAGLVGGFQPVTPVGFQESVAYFTGLLLLIMAFIILAFLTFLQQRFKMRFA